MRYVRRVLQPGETVVYATTLHWLVFLRAIVLFVLALAAWVGSNWVSNHNGNLALLILAGLLALLGLSSALTAWIRRATTELAVTDRRVIYKSGLLSRHTLEMNRSKVESVDVDQSILGRMLGYGTIVVRGTGGSLEPMRKINNPIDFRTHITAR